MNLYALKFGTNLWENQGARRANLPEFEGKSRPQGKEMSGSK